jgi:hypothetical protein
MPFPCCHSCASLSGLGLTDGEILRMVRHVKRYHMASLQDLNPIVAFLHNAYAVGIMDMMRDLADDDVIAKATGEDIKALRREILQVQDRLENTGLTIMRKVGSENVEEIMKSMFLA